MKKIIVLFLISTLTQNLSAAVPFNVDYGSGDRNTTESLCLPGTNSWLPGSGPAMSVEDAYDIYDSWLKTPKGKQYLEEKKEKEREREREREREKAERKRKRKRKGREKAERKIRECLNALPKEKRREVLGNVSSGYETPPLKDRSSRSISTNSSPMSRPLRSSATVVQ